MKISYNWLCEYVTTSMPVAQAGEILTKTGLEVEAIEKVESIPGGLKGVVVGEIVECGKHPDADRLSLTKVNIGSGDPLQIVCGAPNVAAGQKVLVATVGTTLHPSSGEPLTIKKGKIRGQESHGMICAEDELGMGTSHEGILVLDASANPGTPAAEYLGITEDHCIEIGLTPNRTDAFSHYGVARDLAAALHHMQGINNEPVSLLKPAIDAFKPGSGDVIRVEVSDHKACPRYSGITLDGVRVAPSPKWLQDRLNMIGVRPINNVVDITNYVQHEIGQPLHAFDAAAIADKTVVVRMAHEGEKFVSLDGVERTLSMEDLVICDSRKPMCIAGVFGGAESGVSENTTTVFLESAYFNPVYVRKTSRRHGLKTDASFRFERGTDPASTTWALQRAALMILEIAGGQVASGMTDLYPEPLKPFTIPYHLDRAAKLMGVVIPREKISAILSDLEINVTAEKENVLELSVPLYRTDVQREADVTEEVLRIYGFDNVPIPVAMRSSLSAAPKPDPEKLQNKVSDMLSANGFHETMSMSLTRTKYLELAGDEDVQRDTAVEILNPLSSDLGVMRQTLLYSGLETIALNQSFRNTDARLYEFGKAFFKTGKGYTEEKRLSLFLTGRRFPESWNNPSDVVSFSDLKGAFAQLLSVLAIPRVEYKAVSGNHFNEALACYSGKTLLAKLGAVSDELLRSFDIRQAVWYADIRWENVLKALPAGRTSYTAPDKFPAVRRDLSLLLDQAVTYSDIERIAHETERKMLRGVNLFDVYEGKNLEPGKKSYAISFMLQDSAKTMTDQQVDTIMSRILKALEEKAGAALRQ